MSNIEYFLEQLGESPWDLRTLTSINIGYADEVLQTLPGYRAVEAIYDLRGTVSRMESFISDIKTHISSFTDDTSLGSWYQTNSEILNIRFNVGKAIFGAASSAYALRELQNYVCGIESKQQKSAREKRGEEKIQFVDEQEYTTKRKALAGDTGLTDFIFHLRNYSTHRRFINSDWQITRNYSIQEVNHRFILKKDKLLLNPEWTTASRNFILRNGNIDIEEVFQNYFLISRSLTDWIISKIHENNKDDISEYVRCHSIAFYTLLSYSVGLNNSRKDQPALQPFNESEIDLICKQNDRFEKALMVQKIADEKYHIDPIDIIFKTEI